MDTPDAKRPALPHSVALEVITPEQEADMWLRSLQPRLLIGFRAAVYDGVSDAECAERLNVPVERVAIVVKLRGWRDQKEKDSDQRKRNKAIARTWTEHVSAKTQHLAIKALDVTSNAIELGDTKGMANAARAAQSLVTMARQAEGMDKPGSEDAAVALNISVFYLPSPKKALELQAKAEREAQATQVMDAEGELF